MAKHDITSKTLLEINPADWLAFLGQPRPRERVRTIDADLGTIATSADKVILIDDPRQWILHLEFQTTRDPTLPARMLMYNALLRRRHNRPVVSVVILVRPSADGPFMTGVLHNETPIGLPWDFRYEVVRIWKLSTQTLLEGPLSLIPYAPLTRVNGAELPSVIARMKSRIADQADRPLAEQLWIATFIFMGLQYSKELAQRMLAGVREMRESVTYQAILDEGREEGLEKGLEKGRAEGREEGRAKEARELILLLGRERFGAPTAKIKAAINAIADRKALENLSKRILRAKSWKELLNGD